MPQTTAVPDNTRAQRAVARIVGVPTEVSWGQVNSFVPDEARVQTHGLLVCAISLDLEKDTSQTRPVATSIDLGREIITRINEEYYGKELNLETPFDLLKACVSKVAEEYKGAKLEIAAQVVWGKFVYFCIWGESRVYILRDRSISKILLGRVGATGSCSGEFRAGDIFIFATSSFFAQVEESVLLATTSLKSVADIADYLAPYAHRTPVGSLALAVVKPEIAVEISDSDSTSISDSAEEIKEELSPVNTEDADEYASGVRILLEKEKVNRFSSFLENVRRKLPLPVSGDGSTNRKTAVSVGIVLIVLLLTSIGFGIQQKKAHEIRTSYEQRLSEAENAYSDSLLQASVSAPLSREQFIRARQLANELTNEGVKDPRLGALLERLGADEAVILGRVQANLKSFLDLSIVRDGLSASGISLDNGNLAILDKAGKRIVLVAIASKQTNVLGNPDKIGNPQFISASENQYYVFGTNGVISLDKKDASARAIEPDDEWGEIVSLGAFSGSIYLLDKTGRIWRYSSAGDRDFGSKQDWLKTSVDLGDSRDMAIDGSIWVLKGDGSVKKLTRGRPDAFSISGMEEPLKQPEALYTDENLGLVFILDKANSRIVEIDKKGQYKKQYFSPEIANARDFVVSGDTKKIFLLTESKIWETELR